VKVRFLLSSKETKILVLCFHIKYYTKAVEYCVDTVISGGKLPLRDNGKFVSTDVTIPPMLYDFFRFLLEMISLRIQYMVKKEAKNEYRRHP
jgi:hypothetical protein